MALRSLNNPIASFIDYLAKTGTDASIPYAAPSGLTATGGVISDYVDGSNVYRAHIFTSSGNFNISALGDYGSNIDYLVIGGGGAGGNDRGGGGGAGALKYSTGFPVSTSPGVYTVTIGAGGVIGSVLQGSTGGAGSSTSFGPITSLGGGGGGGEGTNASSGGSGGGAAYNPTSSGPATGSPGGTPNSVSPASGWGNIGGTGTNVSNRIAAGGGGAGGGGSIGGGNYGGAGGSGIVIIAYPS